MTELPLLLDARPVGRVRVGDDGCVAASCGRRDDGLYRAFLEGADGRARIGVLSPQGGTLCASRRFSRAELDALGALRGGTAVCSFLFDEAPWRQPPPRFFAEARLERARLAVPGALFRSEGDRRLLALPFSPGAPFPIPELFCLARVESVRGRLCAVFCTDAAGEPIF